jgi:hypothetical protein
LLLEGSDKTLLFRGKISKNGKCAIPIDKLRGALDEDSKGTMKLEIIVDDTYFQPWSRDFVVTASKKLRVEIVEPKPKKSTIKVDVVDPHEIKMKKLTTEIVKSLRKRDIHAGNVMKQRKLVSSFIREATEKFNGDIDTHELLTNVVNRLAKGK